MFTRAREVMLFLLAVVLTSTQSLPAASPWTSLIPYKRVESDPKKSYELAEDHGPWMILAANFAGSGAEKQARDLVLELRSRYKLPAYIHKQTYDFTQPIIGTKRTGETAKMQYANKSKYDGLAVLVGNFRSVTDPDFEKTLARIKTLTPECLDLARRTTSTQRFASFRELQRRMSGDSNKRVKGPMGNAFATRNPLLPDEFYAPHGVDDFVARLNKGVQYSLLNNPDKFTVRVASFRGNATINQREIEAITSQDKFTDKLEVGADKAHRLTMALRERGVEAYEFHDRMESIVTVGSFRSEGSVLANGTFQMDAAIDKVMHQYEAKQRPMPGKGVMVPQPRIFAGIACDVKPMLIEVPRRSVAADYARRGISE